MAVSTLISQTIPAEGHLNIVTPIIEIVGLHKRV